MVIVLYLGLAGVVITLPWFLTNGHVPSLREAALISVMGLSALAAQYCLTIAFQKQKAPVVANLTYLNVVWALVANYWLWSEQLSLNALAGIALIAGCVLSAGSASRRTGQASVAFNYPAPQRRPTPDPSSSD